MIFGFNSDIRHRDTVYHVQSEVRQREQLLQTQVFVHGRCIGKRASSFGDMLLAAEDSEHQLHEMLKAQHRETVEAIRAGDLAALFPPSLTSPLKLQWTDAQAVPAENLMLLRFRVTAADAPVLSARVLGRLDAPGQESTLLQATTAADGAFELRFPLNRASLDEGVLSLQVSHLSANLRGRFRLCKKMIASASAVPPEPYDG